MHFENREEHTGRVYKLYHVDDHDEDDVYIGSTCKTLAKRLQKHYQAARDGEQRKVYKYMREKNCEGFRMELLQQLKFHDIRELRKVEDEWIRVYNPTLNTIGAVLNKEKQRQNRILYDNEHREEINAYMRDYMKEYYRNNQETVAEWARNWNQANKNRNRCETCDYGCAQKQDFERHLRSAKHLRRVAEVEDTE